MATARTSFALALAPTSRHPRTEAAKIDKKKPVLLYCRSGYRSGNALKILRDQVFTLAKHPEGGINAWQAAGLPVPK